MSGREVNYLFESPVGYVECRIREDRTIVYSRPSLFVDATLLRSSSSEHPQLVQAFGTLFGAPNEYHLLVKDPSWALQFWEFLASVPFGTTLSYAELAYRLGLGRGMPG